MAQRAARGRGRPWRRCPPAGCSGSGRRWRSNTPGETALPPARYSLAVVQQHFALAGHAAAATGVEVAGRVVLPADPAGGRIQGVDVRAVEVVDAGGEVGRCRRRPARRWRPARWRAASRRRGSSARRARRGIATAAGRWPPRRRRPSRRRSRPGPGPRRSWADSAPRRRCRPSSAACRWRRPSARTMPSSPADEDQAAGRHRRRRLDGRLGRVTARARLARCSADAPSAVRRGAGSCRRDRSASRSGDVGRPGGSRFARSPRCPRAGLSSRSASLAVWSKAKSPAGPQHDRPEHLQVAVAGPGEPVQMAVGDDHAHVARGPHGRDPLHARRWPGPAGRCPRGRGRRCCRRCRSTACRPGGAVGVAGQDLAGQRVELLGLARGMFCGPIEYRPSSRITMCRSLTGCFHSTRPSSAESAVSHCDLRADEVQGLVGALQIDRALPAADVAVARAGRGRSPGTPRGPSRRSAARVCWPVLASRQARYRPKEQK